MQTRENVRERRRERIQQIMEEQSREDIAKSHHISAGVSTIGSTQGLPNTGRRTAEVIRSEPDFADVIELKEVEGQKAQPFGVAKATRHQPPSSLVSISQDPDPELWWKEREKRAKESHGNWQGLKGIPSTSEVPQAHTTRMFDFNKFMRGFTWRMVCAALLFSAVWGWFRLQLPGSDEAHKWMVSSVTRDMDFEAIEAWYGETFGGSPTFFPFNQDKSDTEAVTARITPQETKVPVVGRVIQSFAQSGAGVKVAAQGGSNVVSIFTGRVQQVTQDQDGGITILVQHPNRILTVYGSLGNAVVKTNDWVETGQILGQLEAFGDREGVLYFAVQENGKTLDPAEVVTFD
ncbi:peptidoglycan DD-metalloendopeptidase family protein [Cohnella sp.]|uniref:peptidoglycan DD-metalloendopeptidase family protein n=1 Tax=Cohnella sp. TaxID=1883426 RepID=UPI0035666BE8